MRKSAKKLIDDFFSGIVYFTFDNKDELNSFSRFIEFYDPYCTFELFFSSFSEKGETKAVAWERKPGTGRLSTMAARELDYFKKYYGKIPIKYSDVRKYAEKKTNIKEEEKNNLKKRFRGLLKSPIWTHFMLRLQF